MRKHKYDYDTVVIGSGAGGSTAAIILARQGKNVAIVEKDVWGGGSSNWSDIPMNALLQASQTYDQAKQGARFGIRSTTVGFNYPGIKKWKDLAVKRTGAGASKKYYENENVDTYFGRAHFISDHELAIDRKKITSKDFIIATGSSWEMNDVQGFNDVEILTPRTALDLSRLPKSVYIFGGGKEAVEMAQFLAAFGSKIYIAESSSRILPNEDEEVGLLMQDLLSKNKNVTVLTETRTLAFEKENIAKRVTYSRGGVESSVRVDQVMVANAKLPEIDLGLENIGIEYSKKGIVVDDYMKTDLNNIYATGDVVDGSRYQTHTALMESRVAANNILYPKKKIKPDYTAVTRLIFTYPGVASVGMSEDDCIRRDLNIQTGLAPLSSIARGNTADFRDGFVKIICDPRGNILGATVVAPSAAEIIHELALAIKYEMSAADLVEMPHAFLSWNEAVRVAASRIFVS